MLGHYCVHSGGKLSRCGYSMFYDLYDLNEYFKVRLELKLLEQTLDMKSSERFHTFSVLVEVEALFCSTQL